MQNNMINLIHYYKEEPYETFICSGRILILINPCLFQNRCQFWFM